MKKDPKAGKLTPEDMRLWKNVLKSIQAYEEQGWKKEPESQSLPPEKAPISPASKRNNQEVSLLSKKRAQVLPRDMDRSTQKKLEKGRLTLESRLDLHGMNQQEAFHALRSFIAAAVEENKRTLLVITGKGDKRKPGVLRRLLPLWLEENPYVLALRPARPKDGGDGAFYIRLRKRRI